MKTPSHLDPTIVTANGKIIHAGKLFDGLVVVDEATERPVISFDEVSDDEVVNVFIQFASGAVFGRLPMGEDEPDLEDVGSDGIFNTHEILIRRADHQPLEKVVGA